MILFFSFGSADITAVKGKIGQLEEQLEEITASLAVLRRQNAEMKRAIEEISKQRSAELIYETEITKLKEQFNQLSESFRDMKSGKGDGTENKMDMFMNTIKLAFMEHKLYTQKLLQEIELKQQSAEAQQPEEPQIDPEFLNRFDDLSMQVNALRNNASEYMRKVDNTMRDVELMESKVNEQLENCCSRDGSSRPGDGVTKGAIGPSFSTFRHPGKSFFAGNTSSMETV